MTEFQFDGRTIQEPGSYGRIISGVQNQPQNLPYGAVLIIDTGSGAGWVGGSGVDGESRKDKDSVYTFDNIDDFRNFVKGGPWWFLADKLFRPNGPGSVGASQVSFVRDAATVSPSIVLTLTNGSITIKTHDEGASSNGVESPAGHLSTGYAIKLSAGVVAPSKFIITMYRGTYRGLDSVISNGADLISGIPSVSSVPEKLWESDEFGTIAEFQTWANNSPQFSQYCKSLVVNITTTGALVAGDLTANTGNILASGGTTTYSANISTRLLDTLKDVYFNFLLSDRSDANATNANNFTLLDFVKNHRIKGQMYVGGSSNNEATSITIGQTFDDDRVTVVHGGVKLRKPGSSTLKVYNSLVASVIAMSIEAGVEPQNPLTFKRVRVEGFQQPLNERQRTNLLKAGVLHFKDDGDFGYPIINQGINTLQNNSELMNPDGTTHLKQIRRIFDQLNNEIIINSKKQLLSNPNGVNRNTLSEQDLVTWLYGYLTGKVATPDTDNLILSFRDITVRRVKDSYQASYGAVPNSEINKLFFTTIMIEI